MLAACTSGGIPKHEDEAQVRERFAAYTGEPIDRMVWLGHFYSWEPIGENRAGGVYHPERGVSSEGERAVP